MDKEIDNILFKALSLDPKSELDKKYIESINFYRECSDLVEKTYLALGKKKKYNITSQSSTNGKINTRTTAATSQI